MVFRTKVTLRHHVKLLMIWSDLKMIAVMILWPHKMMQRAPAVVYSVAINRLYVLQSETCWLIDTITYESFHQKKCIQDLKVDIFRTFFFTKILICLPLVNLLILCRNNFQRNWYKDLHIKSRWASETHVVHAEWMSE